MAAFLRRSFFLLITLLIFLYAPAFSWSNESIPYDKKILIDELSVALGHRDFGQDVADSISEEVSALLDLSGIGADDQALNTFNRILREVVEDELISGGELQRINHQFWGETFSEAELEQLLEFYTSPLGSKLAESMPELLKSMQTSIREMWVRIGPMVTAQFFAEIGFSESFFEDLMGAISSDEDEEPVPSISTAELQQLRDKRCSDIDPDGNRMPLHRPGPLYPTVAQRNGVEGWADVKFDIEPDGTTSNLRVTRSEPGTLFATAAMSAVSRHHYCAGNKEQGREIRITFVMEGNAASLKAGERGAFLETEVFKDVLKQYAEAKARKTLMVADDGGEKWVYSWHHNYRTQAEATERAQEMCLSLRADHEIKALCVPVFEGHTPHIKYADSTVLRSLTDELWPDEYSHLSGFETMMQGYRDLKGPKAMALVENPDGRFQGFYESDQSTLAGSIERVLELCQEEKSDELVGDCFLYRVGPYAPEDVPKVKQLSGRWTGEIKTVNLINTSIEPDSEETAQLTIDNCGDFPRVFVKYPDEDGYEFGRLFEVVEASGNVVLTSVEDSARWAETQAWMVSKISDQQAMVQWSRQVQNLDLEIGEESEALGGWGSGVLTRQADGCEGVVETP